MFRKYLLVFPTLILLLAACTVTSISEKTPAAIQLDEAFLDIDWYLIDMQTSGASYLMAGTHPPASLNFSLDDNPNGGGKMAAGHGGCNAFGLVYQPKTPTSASFDAIISTEVACLGSIEQEVHFFNLLQGDEVRFEIIDEQLLLHAKSGDIIVFSQKSPPIATLLSLQNSSGVAFENVSVHLPNETIAFGSLAAGAITDYRSVHAVFNSAELNLTIADQHFTIPSTRPTDEFPLNGGKFTYLLTLTDGTPALTLKPYQPIIDHGTPQIAIDPILAQLPATTSITFMGTNTIFDEIIKFHISEQWELKFDNEVVRVYTFNTLDLAQQAADSISPDGASFIGPQNSIFIDTTGTTPRYWLQEQHLIYYDQSDTTLLQHLNTAFGTPFINASN